MECGVDQESRGEYLDTGCREILGLTLAAQPHGVAEPVFGLFGQQER